MRKSVGLIISFLSCAAWLAILPPICGANPSMNGAGSNVTLTFGFVSSDFSIVAMDGAVPCASDTTGVISVSGSGGNAPYTLVWTGPNGTNGQFSIQDITEVVTLQNLPAGSYTITVTDGNGIQQTTMAEVRAPDPLEGTLTVSEYGEHGVSCFGVADGSASVGVRGGTEPYTYLWSDGSSDASVYNLSSGEVWVRVEDGNGCPWADTASLSEPPPISIEFAIDPIDCDDIAAGATIDWSASAGGTPPLSIEVNGVPHGSSTLLTELSAGDYSMVITDAWGCSAEDSLSLIAPEIPKLELGPTRVIEYGDTTSLQLTSSTPLARIKWFLPEGYISCTNCPNPTVAPQRNTVYTVQGITEDGCSSDESITIIVRLLEGIFVPNAFSPNGDQVNESFTIYAEDELAVVEELRIYDPWGVELWVGQGFPPNDPTLGWDGTFNGTYLHSGVFVFWGRVRLRGDREVVVKGDITLVR